MTDGGAFGETCLKTVIFAILFRDTSGGDFHSVIVIVVVVFF